MGNKYEVWAWTNTPEGAYHFGYELAYGGDSMLKAIATMLRLRVSGVGCVKFEWR